MIAIATENQKAVRQAADSLILIPGLRHAFLSALMSVIPIQLLAYHIARLCGCEIDQPRNLAKSVTVE